MASASSGRKGWQRPVLILAFVLVIAQVIAFVVLRRSRASESAAPAPAALALVASDAAIVEPIAVAPIVAPVDAAIVEPAVAPDAAVAMVVATPPPAPVPVPVAKKLTRAELAAQARREREELKREEDRRRLEQERDRKRAEQERTNAERTTAAEQARAAAAELERQRIATEKAKGELEAVRAAAEKAKAEIASAQQPAVATKPAAPAGSPDVLVYVLGPGTPSPSNDQLRNVYLGRTSVWANGTTARPMNRPSGSAAGKKFFSGILGMGGGSFQEHWSGIQLTGGGIAPPMISSASSMLAKVRATTGGFGYVLESELPADTSSFRLIRLK